LGNRPAPGIRQHAGDRGARRVAAVVRGLQTRSGHIGYRDQLDRARRFLDRVERPILDELDLQELDDVAFQDEMWAFFQNCWHIKDWISNDPLVLSATKDAVISMAHQSQDLLICRDLSNGTKHFGLRDGAMHVRTDTTVDFERGFIEVDCVIDDGNGQEISGKALARRCVEEWERILDVHGLATARRS
jgi:hypothetical protein